MRKHGLVINYSDPGILQTAFFVGWELNKQNMITVSVVWHEPPTLSTVCIFRKKKTSA